MTRNAQSTPGRWIACGGGIVKHPLSGEIMETRVVELEGFGRIFEVLDDSNTPEENFKMILSAPTLAKQNEKLSARVAELEAALRGCSDALHESEKQFRQVKQSGYASICAMHQTAALAALAGGGK